MQTVMLNNGVEMPLIGFGTYKITDPAECEKCVLDALETGYRHIDTAQAYKNEEYVGRGIEKSGISRDELFITTKLFFHTFEKPDAEAAILESFRKLKVDYLDLILLHWPFGNYYAAYRVLEEFYEAGKVRAIGISNFNPDRMIDLIHYNKVLPAVNQVETHLLCQRVKDNEWMKKYNVQHEAYTPLGQGRKNEMFEHPSVAAIAKAHNKTPAQIALKFIVQRGIAVIPKTTHKSRMKENIDIFDFSLAEAEMESLRKLDRDTPLIGRPQDPDRVESSIGW